MDMLTVGNIAGDHHFLTNPANLKKLVGYELSQMHEVLTVLRCAWYQTRRHKLQVVLGATVFACPQGRCSTAQAAVLVQQNEARPPAAACCFKKASMLFDVHVCQEFC
jgi:hypothetical protein